MKNFFLAFACFLSALASAQKPAITNHLHAPTNHLTQPRAETNSEWTRSRGSEFFYEDFSNGLDGSTAYGAWTVADNADNTIWHLATTTSPDGPIAGGIEALASQTAGNGWMIFDPDQYVGDNPSWVSNQSAFTTGYLTSPEINMSSLQSVLLSYEQYFAYCCFSFSPLTVEVSVDGQLTWESFPGHGDFFEAANTLSQNPLNTVLDISCVAAGQPSVYIRFAYNAGEQAGFNYYFWGVDDVSITTNSVNNDLEISEITNGNIVSSWEFHETPMEQVVAAADGGLTAGVIFANRGIYTQTNVTVLAEFLDQSGAIVHSFQTEPDTVFSILQNEQCPSSEFDTLFIPTGFEPSSLGNYSMRITILGDSLDETPGNNTLEKPIVFSTDEYGHDVTGVSYSGLETNPVTGTTNYTEGGWGNYYTCPNPGSIAYGIATRFGTNSQNNVEFKVGLILQNPDLALAEGDYLTEEYYSMASNWHTGSFTYFPFDGFVDLEQDAPYFAYVLRETEGPGRLVMSVQNGPDSDFSTGSWDRTGSGTYTWFLRQPFTPAIRLIMSERVGVNEISPNSGLKQMDLFPNPAVNETRVSFDLSGSRAVAYEIRDTNGKLMKWSNEGVFSQGANSFLVDVSAIPSGLYMINLVLDGQYMTTKSLTIQR
jgi:hypothetical protein